MRARVNAGVQNAAPGILVTASSFWNASFNHSNFDGGVGVSSSATSAPYPLRPSAILAGGATVIDMHFYPSATFAGRFASIMLGNEITTATAIQVPLIGGEFGAYTSTYTTAASTATQLTSTENGMCTYHFTGFAAWMWSGGGGTWDLDLTPIMQALAPIYNPTFCATSVHQ